MFVFAVAVCSPALTDEHGNCVFARIGAETKQPSILVHEEEHLRLRCLLALDEFGFVINRRVAR